MSRAFLTPDGETIDHFCYSVSYHPYTDIEDKPYSRGKWVEHDDNTGNKE